MTGTEEEVSKKGGMWERRYANVPVCGEIAGKLFEEAFGPLPETGQDCESKPIGFSMEQSLHIKPKTYLITYVVFWAVLGELSRLRSCWCCFCC